MSGRIVGEILDNAPEDLTLAELVVLVAIGENARDATRRAQGCDLEGLRYRTRLKPGTIRNALSILVRRGLLIPLVENVHKGGKHQEYEVTKLHAHHRDVAHIVSLHSDETRHRTMTRSPVDNP